MAAPDASKKRVLVVEDEEDVRKLIARILEPLATVEVASNGAEALVRLQAGPVPDLVVTDLMMPEVDGLTLSKKMKATPALARVPILMLTAKSGSRDMVAGINAGARFYLTKPFKHDELVSKVKKALGIG